MGDQDSVIVQLQTTDPENEDYYYQVKGCGQRVRGVIMVWSLCCRCGDRCG